MKIKQEITIPSFKEFQLADEVTKRTVLQSIVQAHAEELACKEWQINLAQFNKLVVECVANENETAEQPSKPVNGNDGLRVIARLASDAHCREWLISALIAVIQSMVAQYEPEHVEETMENVTIQVLDRLNGYRGDPLIPVNPMPNVGWPSPYRTGDNPTYPPYTYTPAYPSYTTPLEQKPIKAI